jgi:hypothetical protein
MKALPKKLLSLTLFGIAITAVCCVQPAQAFTITMEQMGSNVVANGSGAINLTGLSFIEEGSLGPFINPHVAFIVTGQTGSGSTYDGFTGPTTFGNGSLRSPTLAAETLSEFRTAAPRSRFFWCHRAMFPILLYRTA